MRTLEVRCVCVCVGVQVNHVREVENGITYQITRWLPNGIQAKRTCGSPQINWKVEEARGRGAGDLFADFERGYAWGRFARSTT